MINTRSAIHSFSLVIGSKEQRDRAQKIKALETTFQRPRWLDLLGWFGFGMILVLGIALVQILREGFVLDNHNFITLQVFIRENSIFFLVCFLRR